MVDELRPSGEGPKIAVVIPSYRVRAHVLEVLAAIGPEVSQIVVVDDACPEASGAFVLSGCHDDRVTVLVHEKNQGVGGAMVTGYRYAAECGADIIVKLDGDGQMDPALVPHFVAPLVSGAADYVKGNRFYDLETLVAMPRVRLIGNAVLSFMSKASTGYWKMFDPTNGYTAINTTVLSRLPLHRLHRRYFFESDILFRLRTVQALVVDLPMKPVYGSEQSGLHIGKIIFPFLRGNLQNCVKRIFYEYFLRGFSIASLELLTGASFILFGTVFGAQHWMRSISTGVPATTGTVMLAALPIILGVQFLLSFLAFDFATVPNRAVSSLLARKTIQTEKLPAIRSVTRCGMHATQREDLRISV
ncbi:MAG TPA: glycosyltransferase family 2 protein [Acidobacteriaceae bacterium]|nr:glycosyltransferase family 2 protein [Acidobacteriaceae bacterium]